MSIFLESVVFGVYRSGMDIYWDTDEELQFVGNLAHKDDLAESARLLRGYIEASRRRTYWGPINRDAVVTRAERLLSEAERALEGAQ